MASPQDSDPIPSPLAGLHETLGGRMVPFAGWLMPVQYKGIVAEHQAVRSGCGVFDISHMGEFVFAGDGVVGALDAIFTNRVDSLEIGKGHYTLLCDETGGVIDDLILYRTTQTSFFAVVNASMVETDRKWIAERLPAGVSFDDRSAHYAGMAVQGPDAAAVCEKAGFGRMPDRNEIKQDAGTVLCGTGYTGEAGFEAFCPAAQGETMFQAFLDAGATPCGLGARDSLRLEMGFPLNGSDLSRERTPLEAGLGFFVDLTKEFPGAETMRQQKADGVPTRLRGFEMVGKGAPPRAHYPVWAGGQIVGEVSSGGQSPSLGKGIGMAYLPSETAKIGREIEIEVRGKRLPAEVVKKPFYSKGS